LWTHARRLRPERTNPGPASSDPSVPACRVPCTEADVVGIGEATHGSREFGRLEHAVVRHLVQQGFRTVAVEADVTAMLPVDRYVHEGVGDPVAALSDPGTWLWRTESTLELLRWLRSFNEGRPPENRVRVRGVDLSRPSAPAPAVRSYLSRVDSGETDAVETLLEGVRADERRQARLDVVAAAARSVGDRLERNRAAYVERASAPAWERARHLCRVIERSCEWHRVRHAHEGPHPEGMSERDRLMAENAAWCLERDRGQGVALLAHNSHVKRGRFDDGRAWTDATTMGERLHRRLGDRYAAVGTDFGRGSVRAERAGAAGGPEVFTVAEPRADSATARFEALPGPFLLDLAAAADDDRLAGWLDGPRRVRQVGSVYDPDAVGDHYLRTRLAESFDALAFVPESTPTRPLE